MHKKAERHSSCMIMKTFIVVVLLTGLVGTTCAMPGPYAFGNRKALTNLLEAAKGYVATKKTMYLAPRKDAEGQYLDTYAKLKVNAKDTIPSPYLEEEERADKSFIGLILGRTAKGHQNNNERSDDSYKLYEYDSDVPSYKTDGDNYKKYKRADSDGRQYNSESIVTTVSPPEKDDGSPSDKDDYRSEKPAEENNMTLFDSKFSGQIKHVTDDSFERVYKEIMNGDNYKSQPSDRLFGRNKFDRVNKMNEGNKMNKDGSPSGKIDKFHTDRLNFNERAHKMNYDGQPSARRSKFNIFNTRASKMKYDGQPSKKNSGGSSFASDERAYKMNHNKKFGGRNLFDSAGAYKMNYHGQPSRSDTVSKFNVYISNERANKMDYDEKFAGGSSQFDNSRTYKVNYPYKVNYHSQPYNKGGKSNTDISNEKAYKMKYDSQPYVKSTNERSYKKYYHGSNKGSKFNSNKGAYNIEYNGQPYVKFSTNEGAYKKYYHGQPSNKGNEFNSNEGAYEIEYDGLSSAKLDTDERAYKNYDGQPPERSAKKDNVNIEIFIGNPHEKDGKNHNVRPSERFAERNQQDSDALLKRVFKHKLDKENCDNQLTKLRFDEDDYDNVPLAQYDSDVPANKIKTDDYDGKPAKSFPGVMESHVHRVFDHYDSDVPYEFVEEAESDYGGKPSKVIPKVVEDHMRLVLENKSIQE